MSNKEDEIVPLKVKQISVKTCGYSAKVIRKIVEEHPKEVVFLARVGGVVSEYFVGTSKLGEFTGLRGMFTLINKDNEAFHSSVCFLPSSVTNKIVQELKEGVLEANLLVDISVTESDKNASGYAYNCEGVMSEAAVQRANEISDRVISSRLPVQKRLAGPAKEDKIIEQPKKNASKK